MLGQRSPQKGLFEADTLHLDFVGRESFHGFLASLRGQLFRDEDFAGLYREGWGRPSVPPSLLATALVLQWHDRVSDEEARERACYDLRWKVALGIGLEERPFAKSTLQEFRAQLVVHKEQGAIFQRSLELAKKRGRLKGRLRLALDTTNILGRGAVKDTYNLLGDGIVLVLRALARQAGITVEAYAEEKGFGRYLQGPSLKGQAEIDWNDASRRREFLAGIVADADRLLAEVRTARGQLEADSPEDQRLQEAAGLLSRVLQQDIERREDGPRLREGVAKDRMPSVHDPEMRHGRKSKAKRFDGHKLQMATDTESQLITAVAVLPGNAADHDEALAVVEESEARSGCEVEETVGDTAYGDGATRQQFADAGRKLVAKVAPVTNQGRYPRASFRSTSKRRAAPVRPSRSRVTSAPQAKVAASSASPPQYVAPVPCGPSVCGERAAAACRCIRRRRCCKRRGPFKAAMLSGPTAPYARWRSIAWRAWSSSASGKRATAAWPRPFSKPSWSRP